MDPIQNPLFREPIGMTFRAKRELMDLTVEDAAKALKFGTHLIEAIEHEEWQKARCSDLSPRAISTPTSSFWD